MLTGTGTVFRARVPREVRAARRDGVIGGGEGVVLVRATAGPQGFSPFRTGITLLFVLERTLTVRRAGRRAVLLAPPLVPEPLYDAFRQLVFVKSLIAAGLALRSLVPVIRGGPDRRP
ncbi:hypothetical protein ACFVU3_20415 [Streptomyces sp. NPDC058052]|uniref:hypothetical protein n=1 Tax=Streptomyces sp. NPDC058052 TaxID=3346316 RepID=UPI0036E72C82